MSDMRYESGNWGDVLKGLWTQSIVAHSLRAGEGEFRVCDGFAGHPVYGLTPGTRLRLLELGDEHPYVTMQRAYVASDRLASAATIARDTLWAGLQDNSACVTVFDIEPHKRQNYAALPGFELAPLHDGFEILEPQFRRRYSLLMLDPYEFVWRYEELLPPLLAATQDCDVLIYLFDKAPQSGGYRRNYTNFLHDLDRARPTGDFLLGRAPADGFLPQIYHEMLYLPRVGTSPAPALGAELRERTARLAEHILSQHGHLRGRL